MPIVDFAKAQRHPPMRTTVESAPDLMLAIAPKDQFLAQTGDPNGPLPNLFRGQRTTDYGSCFPPEETTTPTLVSAPTDD